jgi:hypothetical protein
MVVAARHAAAIRDAIPDHLGGHSHMPGHIGVSATPASKPGQAACRNLGGMPGLITPDQRFRDDDGAAEPLLAAALAAYAAGQASEHAVLTALARARLLVPVVAALTQTEDTKAPDGRVLRREKASDMTIPVLTGRDGRRAIIAFTSMDALSSWRRDARPLPAGTDQVCQAAAAEAAHAVVVDVAGPLPLVVEGARLAALAAGKPAPLPADDPDVRAAVDAVVAADPGITAAELVNGPGGTSRTMETEGARETAGTMETEGTRETAGTMETAGSGETRGTDLTVRLVLSAPPGGAAEGFASAQPEAAARRAAATIMTSLAGRFRRGIEIVVVPGPPG